MKLTLPYLRIVNQYSDISSRHLNDALRAALDLSAKSPCYLEVSDNRTQRFLFFREKQIYSAGGLERGQFSDSTIKDFFHAVGQMASPTCTCYQVNSKILHSLLILFQKKPSLTLLTSLVDLDEVLDKIEDEKKSCIVCASQDAFIGILRYERGHVTAFCHKESHPTPKENSFREDFLVSIYTLSAEKAFTITVYDDLLVKYSQDAKMIDAEYDGDITDLFLSKPPVVSLVFKGKEIGQWVLDKPTMNIGRTEDNDIVIDNLGVSRLHAALEKEKGEYFVRDCDSLNGTLLNGRRVGRAKIQDGDEIVIGKHTLRIQRQSGLEFSATQTPAPFDQTVIIGPGQTMPPPTPPSDGDGDRVPTGPRLISKISGDVIVELNKTLAILGKGAEADVPLDGMLVAKEHAKIMNRNGELVIRHVNGLRKLTVGGKTVKECVLKKGDEIRIGKNEFVFQE